MAVVAGHVACCCLDHRGRRCGGRRGSEHGEGVSTLKSDERRTSLFAQAPKQLVLKVFERWLDLGATLLEGPPVKPVSSCLKGTNLYIQLRLPP